MKPILSILFAAAFATMVPVDTAAQTADCGQVSTESFLNANGVRAKILNNGGLFWNGRTTVYTVDGSNAIFAANLLVGGLVDGELRTAASTYGPHEFWPGPADSMQTNADCERFNRMYRIALRDVNAYEEGDEPPADLLEWPWELGAPVVDGDGNPDNYNLAGGDRPEILGSEMVYWIMNDVGGVHERTGTTALGIEVHGTAFAAPSSDPAFDDATFYRYRIINRSDRPIEQIYAGIFVDPDLGAAFDDYVGSDSLAGLAFVYNADNDDDGNYGLNPPAVGFRMFEGPEASPDGYDNDYDGSIDEPGERLGMSYFAYFNEDGITGGPEDAGGLYNYMQGRWKDGLPITEGGNGLADSTKPVRFAYPADPPEYWSELNSDGTGTPIEPADRRFIQSMGPFRLAPGEETELFVGILYARAEDNLASRSLLEEYALRMDGLRPEEVTSDLGPQQVKDPPRLVSPADGSVDLLTSVQLEWSPVQNGLVYQLEIERTDESEETGLFEIRSTDMSMELVKNARYSWRVRAFSATDYGPWSAPRTFETGSVFPFELGSLADAVVVRNAAGPLAEPVGAMADWQGFPGSGPPGEHQQVGPARWLVHTYSGGNPDRASFLSFHRRVYRNGFDWGAEYEIRFTGASMAMDFQTREYLNVPFELWFIGHGTPDDASDDFRMIPWVLDSDEDGWGLSTWDHPVSDEGDDPETDAIYFNEPVDTSPGSRGYDQWESAIENDQEDPSDYLGDERFARLTFVNWNAGEPGSDDIEQLIPEEGTIFRISNAFRPPPILHVPALDAVLTEQNAVFSWSVVPFEKATLEVAQDAAFTNVVLRVSELDGLLPAPSLVNLDAGRYFWRVTGAMAGTSETGTYLVGTNVGIDDPETTDQPAILDVYPVPATDVVTLRLKMPGSTRAELSIFDVLGRRVISDLLEIAPGESTFTLPLDRLAPGAYFVRIDTGTSSLNARFVVADQ